VSGEKTVKCFPCNGTGKGPVVHPPDQNPRRDGPCMACLKIGEKTRREAAASIERKRKELQK
jgi:hypothetical protein